MDKCTREVRKQSWKNIITQCMQRPEGMTAKQLKKATKLVDKDLFLGLGWLLREDKVSAEEVEGELFIKLI